MWKEVTAAIAGAGLFCLGRSEYEKKTLSVETVEIKTDKIDSDRTFVFLSDLHDNEFGTNNEKLLKAIQKEKPEAVLIGGDMMVTKKGQADFHVVLPLFEALAKEAPVFAGNGNHEKRMAWKRQQYGNRYEEYRNALKQCGVCLLENDSADFGKDVRITGADLEYDFYKKRLFQKKVPMEAGYLENSLGEPDNSRFQILLAHSPLYFKEYREWGADLTLSGHFHGGTIRLPFVGGVMTPQYQFFHPYCGGTFEKEGKWMVVSRGLGTHSINIRFNNLPQLVVLKLKKTGEDHGSHYI